MKKYLLILLSLLLIVINASAQDTHNIVERSYTFYDGSIDDPLNKPFPLYFMDGVDDLPYVALGSQL